MSSSSCGYGGSAECYNTAFILSYHTCYLDIISLRREHGKRVQVIFATASVRMLAPLSALVIWTIQRSTKMNKAILTTLIAASAMIGGCATYGSGYDDGGHGYYDRTSYSRYGSYDYNRPDPAYNGYYADRYYRDDRRYRERRLNDGDRVYRGENGQYYCRRSDGTTGLIVGAIAGGFLGNIIARGNSDTLGTILGAVAGGAAGRAIDRSDVRCR